eukprot:417656-Prorocentrum_lima.AAC.1
MTEGPANVLGDNKWAVDSLSLFCLCNWRATGRLPHTNHEIWGLLDVTLSRRLGSVIFTRVNAHAGEAALE